MLKTIRIILAALFFLGVTALFLDVSGALRPWLGWTAKMQLLPAAFALNAAALTGIALLTLLFGRVYCSVVCPLGVFQDIVSGAGAGNKKRRRRPGYVPERRWLRYGVLALFLAAAVLGAGSIAALLEPYSAFGRMVSNLFAPFCGWGNNLLAAGAEKAGSCAFSETSVWMRGWPTFAVSALTFAALAVLARRHGRAYCGNICPVGTLLGLLSRFSLFRPVVDPSLCRACGICARQCKAACIDFRNHRVDASRCVACMDCIGACREHAIRLRPFWKEASAHASPPEGNGNLRTPGTAARGGAGHPASAGRRNFLHSLALMLGATAAGAEAKKVDGGLAVIGEKKAPRRLTPLVPPGAHSLRDFARHCTGCQLCVSACPNDVLRPSSDWARLMQPEMSYERGYCRPECIRCSQLCPSGAILPVTVETKSSIRIGRAVWVRERCIPLRDGQACGNCARHCPSGAILMTPVDPENPESLRVPVINEERCIGCGACENLCPARPFSAIYVEGREIHSTF